MSEASVLFARYMLSHNYAAAERVCRVSLRTAPEDAFALAGLALLSRRIGYLNYERLFLSRMGEPFGDRYRMPPPPGQIVAPVQVEGARRFIVIVPRGCGMWSDFASVVGAYILAWRTGRVPVVSWRQGCRYNDDGEHDAFTDFFAPLSPAGLDALAHGDLRFEPAGWSRKAFEQAMPPFSEENRIIDILASAADVVVSRDYVSPYLALDWAVDDATPSSDEKALLLADLYRRLVRPVPKLAKEAASFVRQARTAGSFAAVHLRGTDKFKEAPAAVAVNSRLLADVSRSPHPRVFVMTDDLGWLAKARGVLGERMLSRDSARSNGAEGLHLVATAGQRRALGVDIVVETTIAADADAFYGSGESNVSATIALLRAGTQRDSQLVGANSLLSDRDWGLTRW